MEIFWKRIKNIYIYTLGPFLKKMVYAFASQGGMRIFFQARNFFDSPLGVPKGPKKKQNKIAVSNLKILCTCILLLNLQERDRNGIDWERLSPLEGQYTLLIIRIIRDVSIVYFILVIVHYFCLKYEYKLMYVYTSIMHFSSSFKTSLSLSWKWSDLFWKNSWAHRCYLKALA